MSEQGPEPDPTEETAGETRQGTEPDEPHDPAGLDLARAAARAAAAAGGDPAKARRHPRRGGPGALGSAGEEQVRRSGRRRSRLSGPGPDERDPQPLEGVVARLIGARGWEIDLRVHAVIGRWEALVGAEIADHCTPESFVDGRLVVRTDSTAWATQLKLLAPTLLRRLNEEVGAGTVTALDVLGPQGPSWKKGPRSVRDGRGPRDTYG
ncbi:DciA family protein [Nocardioides zeae]|uniref:UPF0232 protein RDV89_07860 n=1 Tax=Nocardioides imazamoxiresistens TaxID=3231893 RepID=A0ABU3PW50_9ACTN|nr:DciA family protein [Nocardioides zeae]MDT9592980.1 DciA family protein [Nocardioides zeae]